VAAAAATTGTTGTATRVGTEYSPPEGTEGTTVPGDEGVVADKEEGDGQYTDDCDDKWGEHGAGVVGTWASNVERRRRREDEVAPLGAVHATQPLRAIFG
jgi:hypothetical protein